jgi:lauroyl/myristoyl acyltransferase
MIKKSFSYIGVVFLSFLSLLPMQLLYLISAMCYYVLYYVTGYRRAVVRENLVNSFPEKSIERTYYHRKRVLPIPFRPQCRNHKNGIHL